jgi:hypothetical protein
MMAGKYIRHWIAVLVGTIFVWLLDKLPALQTYIPAETLAGVQETIVGVLTVQGLIVWGIVYAWAEKWLKRFPTLDPEGVALANAGLK